MSDPPSFDLCAAPWIPAIDLAGARVELGIHDVLVRAHQLRELADGSPLVEVALLRLLRVILHRIVDGPRSADAWQALWEAGRFDERTVDRYLDPLAHRFDLFGSDRPFYQERGLIAAGVRPRPIVRLTHELASEGNAALLFDHTLEAAFEPARAARYLVAYQTFALGGLVTPPPGSSDRSSVDAPAARAAHLRVRGGALFETLLLNLVRYEPDAGVPVAGTGEPDLPAWERPTAAAVAAGATRQPTGYLDVLTWQSRRIELAPPRPDGTVDGVALLSGERVAPGRELWALDPVSVAFVPRRAQGGGTQLRELRLAADRALWRDSTALLAAGGTLGRDAHRPVVLDWVGELAFFGYGGLGDAALLPVEAAGLVANQAKTELWRRETVALPAEALGEEAAVERVREALRVAERAGALLGAGDVLVDAAGHDLPRPLWRIGAALLGTGERRPRPDAIRTFVAGLGAGTRYWSALGPAFGRLVADLAAAGQDEDPDRARVAAVEHWEDAVADAARDAFRRATSGLGGSPRTLLAVAAGEESFRYGLARAVGRVRRQEEVATR
jgi:CRISPR system Cascade subunit CasA